ncbi:putative methyltransferase [Oxalobacteraceae bacterium GrIS 1.11]
MHFPKYLLKLTVLSAALALAAPMAPAFSADAATTNAIQAAVSANNHWRSDAEKARDGARRPADVLAFLDIAPGMTVVENFPGGGWYSHILGPLLKDKGTYFGAEVAPEIFVDAQNERREAQAKALEKWQASFPEAQREMAGPKTQAFFYGRQAGQAGYLADASVDLVFDARNIHNLITSDNKKTDRVFAEYFRVLKAGGVLGIIDHRENEASERAADKSARLGYVKESVMIALAEKAGFKLVARSDILSNPKDSKDYANGVWTLPPVLALKDKDKAKYQAIGESDRMLLKFVKPKA